MQIERNHNVSQKQISAGTYAILHSQKCSMLLHIDVIVEMIFMFYYVQLSIKDKVGGHSNFQVRCYSIYRNSSKQSQQDRYQQDFVYYLHIIQYICAMNIPDPTRYLAKEISTQSSILKEVSNSRKKQINGFFDKVNTLVIDYGSQKIAAGYEWSDGPELTFRPQISKNKDLSKNEMAVKAFVNTSYDQLDFTKNNYKSPYERNIILHFSLLEQCNDYIFSELARPNKRIRSPLIITEPFANPTHCRTSFLQQLFECYEIDSVMVGVDALFAYFYEIGCSMTRYESQTAFVINIGATSIHMVAIVNGKVDYSSVRRINIGGNNAFQLFSKSILLKNNQLKDKLNYGFVRQIYEKFTSVAIDYREQLQYFESRFKQRPNQIIYRNRVAEANKHIDQKLTFIPGVEIDFDSVAEIPEEELRRKEQVRKRMSEKLKDTLNRRKQMKKKMLEIQLKNYQQLKERYINHDKFAHQQVCEMFGDHKPLDKLEKKIKTIEVKLGLAEQKGQETKFNLISIPDHELPPEKLKYKKLQIYQKQALELRRQKQKEKQEEEQRMKELRENNPELYLHQLKETYKSLSTRIKENERIKSQLSNRKSKLKQRKMQVIARLAQQDFDPDMQQGEDDWLAYKDVEESDHYSELQAMQAELREIDPEWTQAKDHHHLKQTNQLFLLADLVKCHEIYFQPMIIGVNQLDLIHTITQLLASYPDGIANQLRQNIFVVGGGSKINGLAQRLKRDLIRESPTGSKIGITIGKQGYLSAYMGMQYIGRYQREQLQSFSYKRQDYLSKGGNVFVANPWSNPKPSK